MIGVVDYGVGNVQAFLTLFSRLNLEAIRINEPSDFQEIDRLILPGVGHFDHAMKQLNTSGLRNRLEEAVLSDSVPILGVCVGMQMLASSSDEGNELGLGWVPGSVRSLNDNCSLEGFPTPHMGWNDVLPRPSSLLFRNGFDSTPQFYFLHSFFFDAVNREDVTATAVYGIEFDAVVSRGHIHGVQCHPEKSHGWGMQLLKNFAEG